MLPELGHFALILALLLAGLQAFFGIAGPAFARDRWTSAVTSAVAGQFVMVATAVGCLIASFVDYDFSVAYVAENSNTALPLFYRVAALWGAHEGSLLLWILLLAAWTVAVALGSGRLPPRFAARVLGVLGVVSFGFLLFTLATSIPSCKIRGSRCTRPSSIPATWAFRSRSPSLARRCSRAGSIRTGRAGRGRGRPPPGRSSPAALLLAASGPITSSAGAGSGSGTRSRTLPSCHGWQGRRSCTHWR